MELFRLLGTIAINNSEANDAIDETSGKTDSFGEKLSNGIKTVGKWGVAIGAAAVGAGTAITAFAAKASAAGDNIDKMSQKIGISRQAYQELDFICSQSGTSVDTLQMGIKTLTNQMQSAADGTASAVDIFDKLGVSIYDNNGQLKDQETMMWEAMSALQAMENQTEKAALANDLFGRSGSELMPLLNGAEGSIEAMKKQAHELGLVMSDEFVNESVKFTDTMDQFKRSVSSAGAKIAGAFIPYIQKGVDKLVEFMPRIQEIASVLAGKFGQSLEGIVEKLGKFKDTMSEAHDYLCDTVYFGFEAVWESVQNLASAFTPLIDAVKCFLEPLKDAETQQGINIAICNALEEGLRRLADVINIVASVLGTVIQTIVTIGVPAIQAMAGVFNTLREVVSEAIDQYIIPLIQDYVSMIQELLAENQDKIEKICELFTVLGDWISNVIQNYIYPIFQWFIGIVRSSMDNIKAVMQSGFDFIGGIVDFFIALFKGDWQGMWDAIISILTSAVQMVQNWFTMMQEFTASIMNSIWSKITAIWENIKLSIAQKIENIVSNAKTKFQEILSSITEKMESAKDAVYNAIEKIKGFFDFEWHLPELKLPHIVINGEWDLKEGKFPSFGVEWYAKGAVLNRPTIFGMNGMNAMVGGEAGAEAVAPIDVLQGYVAQAVASQNAGMVEYLIKILDALLGMREGMKDDFIEALESMRLELNNREFCRLVKAVR